MVSQIWALENEFRTGSHPNLNGHQATAETPRAIMWNCFAKS